MREIEVWKSNTLLNAKSQWNAQEQKLFNVVLSDLNEEKGETFVITKAELEDVFKVKMHTDDLRKLTKSMIKKGFSIQRGKKSWSEIQIFSSIYYDDGILSLNMTKESLPYLYVLRNFTKYTLDDILNFKSKYSIRVFELLKREVFKQKSSFSMSLEEFREFVGVKDDEYKRFCDFDTYVLKKAKEEINKYTSIKFDYEKIKQWRTVTDIKFKYSEEKIKIPKAFDFKEFSPAKNEKIMKIATNKAIEINGRNNWNITPGEYLEVQVGKTKEAKPDNIYGFLIRALEEDWAGLEESKNIEVNQISFDDITIKSKEKKTVRNKKKPIKDFEEREYDFDKQELELLGWDMIKK